MSREKRTKYHVRKRIFLNRDLEMRAFAVAIVQDTRDIPNTEEKNWEWTTIELTLSDCNRQVSYDFNLNTAQDRANSLYKIRRIAAIVNAVKDAIEIEATSIGKRKIVKPIEKLKAESANG